MNCCVIISNLLLIKLKTMKNQILSLVFFMLTTTLMVVQGESKENITTSQTEVRELITIAQTDARINQLIAVDYR